VLIWQSKKIEADSTGAGMREKFSFSKKWFFLPSKWQTGVFWSHKNCLESPGDFEKIPFIIFVFKGSRWRKCGFFLGGENKFCKKNKQECLVTSAIPARGIILSV